MTGSTSTAPTVSLLCSGTVTVPVVASFVVLVNTVGVTLRGKVTTCPLTLMAVICIEPLLKSIPSGKMSVMTALRMP